MAGDLHQLEPVVVSKKEENPLSAYVGDSVMRRRSAANHQIQLVYLVEDYRRLQELFNFSNELFYDKTLRLALNSPVHQENTIRPALQAAMAHPQFFFGGGGVFYGLMQAETLPSSMSAASNKGGTSDPSTMLERSRPQSGSPKTS